MRRLRRVAGIRPLFVIRHSDFGFIFLARSQPKLYNQTMLILGAHMSVAGGFAQAALKTGAEFGCNAMQIFTKSPRSRFVKPIDPQDAAAFKNYCRQYGIRHVVAHSSYLLNFGKPAAQIPWAVNDIVTDFERLAELGGHGIIVHIGKSLDGGRASPERAQEALPLPGELAESRLAAIKNVIENAKKIVDLTQKLNSGASGEGGSSKPGAGPGPAAGSSNQGLQYILENTAGQGSEIGFRLDELALIWKELKTFSPRIKSCLDTAHIWGAGYDIGTQTGAEKTLKEYDQLIGLGTLSCIHFNDSKKLLGSRVDRHDNIGRGNIGLEGLKAIAQFAEKHSVPMILETPEKDGLTHLDDIKKVKNELLG
jgi:deoxyribonuclease-4